MSQRRRLLVTFDAFGTLFTPREPIAKSYADAARKCGISGFTDDQVASSFREAFKQESKKAPNYGKKKGLKAPEWWLNVILSTFRPFNSSATLPEDLVPKLLQRFSSSEGYMLYPDVHPLFERLRKVKEAARDDLDTIDLSVGVITNSDDRVTSILSSLGVSLGLSRQGSIPQKVADGVHLSSQNSISDIDFIAFSYDIEFEKPSREIFEAAKRLGSPDLLCEGQDTKYFHVGDDLNKDLYGSQQAGWEGVLLDREKKYVGTGLQDYTISDLSELGSRILASSK